jgi:hypothetical protein
MIGTVQKTMERIEAATEQSQIAVFETTNEHGRPALLSVFAGTVETQRMISCNEPPLVGAFHGGQDPLAVRKLLAAALR